MAVHLLSVMERIHMAPTHSNCPRTDLEPRYGVKNDDKGPLKVPIRRLASEIVRRISS